MQNLRLTDRVRIDAGETSSQSRRAQSQRLVQQWQTLNVTPGEFQGLRAKAILAEILRLCGSMVRQFLLQMLAEDSLSELDDLVNLTLCRIENKLSTYDATRSSFESWVKYQCVRPIFKQHLEEIGYRTVKIEPYIAALQARLNGLQSPPTNLIGRLVEGLDHAQLRSEILKMHHMSDAGRKVILRRDPRLVPALSLNCPIRPGAEKEEFLDVPAAPKPLDMEDTCRETLHQSLSCLTAGERMVVLGLFFGNRTRKELADEAGISSARISQLLHQAYKRLREVLSPTFSAIVYQMTSYKPMPIPDDAAFNERLERELPRLLADHSYDFQQDLEDFCSEEASLDAEIDQIWEQVVEEEIPIVIIEKPKPAWAKPWIGLLAASAVVGLGVTAFMTLDRGAPNASTLRSIQIVDGPESLAQALQQQWRPKVTAQASRNIILSAKVEPGDPKKLGVHLLQSSGDSVVDGETIKTASTISLYELPGQKLPVTYVLDFDLRTSEVSVTQK